MLFLNLDFLSDDIFAWDGQLDPSLQVASHYLEDKREPKVCLEYLTEERDAKSLMHKNDNHIKTFGTVKKLRDSSLSCGGQQKYAHMRIQQVQRIVENGWEHRHRSNSSGKHCL